MHGFSTLPNTGGIPLFTRVWLSRYGRGWSFHSILSHAYDLTTLPETGGTFAIHGPHVFTQADGFQHFLSIV